MLVFETGEDMGLVQKLLEKHRHNIFLDTVKGVGCVDHYMAANIADGRQVRYTPPEFQYRVGRGGLWTSDVTAASGGAAGQVVAVEAETGAECLYKVVEGLLGGETPDYDNFIRWWCHPSFSSQVNTMSGAHMEHILEMLPLQNHLQRSLRTQRVNLNLEVWI